MSAIVCSVFPCCGKTYLAKNQEQYHLKVMDSDSSNFHWIYQGYGREINPDWPNNYVNHIKENMNNYDIILVSSHKEIREGLAAAGVEYLTIYPDRKCKAEWVGRAVLRDLTWETYPACTPEAMAGYFDIWFDSCATEKNRYVMDNCEYLSNSYLLKYILSFRKDISINEMD